MIRFKREIMRLICILLLAITVCAWNSSTIDWLKQQHEKYSLNYTEADAGNILKYTAMLDNGIRTTQDFFGAPFQKKFDVFIYPARNDLDSQWRKDWNMPQFKSECWMVASGVAAKLDLISPAKWEQEACEHSYSDTLNTQRLITHELVHVYHGQTNASPDFSDVTGIDWLVEGLATYASGQLNASKLAEVRNAIAKKEIPAGLDNFWTGKLRYGLSGSVVMYIDQKFGREKLKQLLPLTRKEQVLNSLGLTEIALINGWKEYITTLKT